MKWRLRFENEEFFVLEKSRTGFWFFKNKNAKKKITLPFHWYFNEKYPCPLPWLPGVDPDTSAASFCIEELSSRRVQRCSPSYLSRSSTTACGLFPNAASFCPDDLRRRLKTSLEFTAARRLFLLYSSILYSKKNYQLLEDFFF